MVLPGSAAASAAFMISLSAFFMHQYHKRPDHLAKARVRKDRGIEAVDSTVRTTRFTPRIPARGVELSESSSGLYSYSVYHRKTRSAYHPGTHRRW
jgi:hypothetical protein